MKCENLIGKTFFENEFYELLLFDIEENFEQYASKYIHFYFRRLAGKKIMITELAYFDSPKEMDNLNRKIIEKREWFEIEKKHNHISLTLCRLDRSGTLSIIEKDSTHTQDWQHGWGSERHYSGPMTPNEIRQAVLELSGFFDHQQGQVNLRSKKSI